MLALLALLGQVVAALAADVEARTRQRAASQNLYKFISPAIFAIW